MSDQGGGFHRRPAESFALADDLRWDGILSREQVARFRAMGLPLAFDPVQIGWVPLATQSTDRPHALPPLSWTPGLTRNMQAPAQIRDPFDLRLRPWTDADVPTYRSLLDDAEVWRFMPEEWPGTITSDLARSLIEISNAADHHEVRAILHRDRPIGQVRLAFPMQDIRGSEAEISYWLGRAYWGQGLGQQAVAMGTRHAFETHADLQRIMARVHPDNQASIRVLMTAGYRHCGQRDDGWQIYAISR